MTTCTTTVPYSSLLNPTSTAIITTYSCTPLPPSFLRVTSVTNQGLDKFNVELSNGTSVILYTLTIDYTNPKNPVGNISNNNYPILFPQGSNGFSSECCFIAQPPNAFYNRITLTQDAPFSPETFVPGDVYDILLFVPVEGLLRVTPSRNQGTTFSSSLVPAPNTPVPSGASTTNNTVAMSNAVRTNITKSNVCMTCPEPKICTVCNGNPKVCIGCACFTMNTCGNLRVPIVNIIGQTTVDFCNIGDVIFTICDEFTYYKEQPLPPSDRCEVIYAKPEQIKQTKFHKCCPPMEIVVKGKGATLYDKAVFLYNEMASSIGPSFYTFYFNLILYGMAKYILARILYGKFNLKYLLGKYNEKFLKDLGESRFCEFVLVFEDCQLSPVFGYGRFFKFGHHKSKSISESSQTNQSS
jgi:hypothetical protein